MKAKNENKHIALCIAMFITGTFLVALVQPYTRQEEFIWQWYIGYAGILMIIGSGLISLFKLSDLSQEKI